jgi:biopolymer transport protein ExbD
MRFGKPKIPESATFDLTPMIDVILLLIIFFMFTSHFARTQQTPMDLPKEKGEKSPEAPPASLVIDISRDGTYRVLGTDTDLKSLTAMIQGEVLRLGSSLDLVIRADRDCPATHLNRLAEALAGIGVRDWKLATQGENS